MTATMQSAFSTPSCFHNRPHPGSNLPVCTIATDSHRVAYYEYLWGGW
ncbi:unnamed protein product [Rhodiola kirilowii]